MEQTVKLKKRLTWLLVLVMLFGLLPMAPTAQAEGFTSAQIALRDQADGQFENGDKVNVIVQLKEKPIEYRQLNSLSAKRSRMDGARSARESVQSRMKSRGIDFKVGFTYSLLLNGFSGETTLAHAMELAALPEVASVEIAAEFDAPDPVEEPKMKSSAGMVSAAAAWELGYEGQGQLIAVLDSGADPYHRDFVLTDVSKAKYPTASSMETAVTELGLAGKVFNDKVIYGFNYKDLNQGIKEVAQASGMHGMRVAGTTAANGDPDSGGVRGIAPEAQLLIMRVFGEAGGGTNETIYLKAIEDAVALGADSINMSLGSPAGVIGRLGTAFLGAIQKASEIGSVVNIAAGNEGYFGSSYDLPKADAPDYGIVATPSIAPLAMSVASLNNESIQMIAIELADGTRIPYKISGEKNPVFGTPYELIYLGLGRPEDVAGKDATGKVALIERGEINFTDKISNAHSAGAVAVIIFNSEAGGDSYVSMVTDGAAIPAVSITRTNGLMLAADPQVITFSDELISETSAIGGEMSDFSNWGLSSEQNVKPEITAPGGDIYSTLNDDTYGGMSGTSMATPHVAGGVSLINERVKKDFPYLTGAARYTFIKNLMMSTATPHIDPTADAPTSPRKQGAGVMNLAGAATSSVIAADPQTGLSALNLKDVPDQFTLQLELINEGDAPVTYRYEATLQTDAVKDGRFMLAPRLLETIPGGSVTVDAHTTREVTLTVDASDYTQELSALMPNGYFLEGFVIFTSDEAASLSIPYVGFKGVWNDIPVLEKSIYDHEDGETPFYFTDTTTDFTHFYSTVSGKTVVMGHDAGKTPAYDRSRLVISPNGDGKLDVLNFRGTFLRNYKDLTLSVYSPDGTEPVYKSYASALAGTKNHFSGDTRWEKSTANYSWRWNGAASNYSRLADGNYHLDVSVTPNIAGASPQVTRFPVIIDTQAPSVKDAAFDEATRGLTFTAIDLISEVQSVDVTLADGTGITPDESGAYVIPDGIDLSAVTLTITDLGLNVYSDDAANALIPVYHGSIVISASTSDGSRVPSYEPVVRNEKGEVQTRLTGLEYGTYTVEATQVEKGYLTDKSEYTVTLTEDQPLAKVNFVFEKPNIPTGEIAVIMTVEGGEYPEAIDLIATDSKGTVYPLAQDSYLPTWYVADVPYETYTISYRSIAEGWAASPETAVVTVSSSYPPFTYMTLAKGSGGRILPEAVGKDGVDVSSITFAAEDFYGETVDLAKPLPNGVYTVYPASVPQGTYVTPQYQEVELTDLIPEANPVFTFRPVNGMTGSVTIETVKARETYPDLDIVYEVEDFYGNIMTDLDQLPPGTYYVHVIQSPMEYMYTPRFAEISVTPDQPDHTVSFKFTKLSDTGLEGTLNIWVSDPSYTYRSTITFEIKDEAGNITTLVYDRLSYSANRVKLPYGVYEVRALDIQEGYYIEPETVSWPVNSMYSYLDFELKQGKRPVKIAAAEQPDAITVPFGTTLDKLALPETAQLILSDETTDQAPILWDLDAAGFNGEMAGSYLFTGTLDLTGKDYTNPDEIRASQEVIVAAKTARIIESVQSFESMAIAEDTPWTALQLPVSAKTELDDASSVDLMITWHETDYDPNRIGIQTISGTLILPEDGSIENPEDIMVSVDLIIASTERIYGRDRYATSIEISRRSFDRADTVILVSGAASPDAPLASPLSIVMDAPILMIRKQEVSAEAKAELMRLGAEHIILIGGNGVIGDQVEEDLRSNGYNVERLGGVNRFETAMLVDTRIRSLTGVKDQAVIANGVTLFDAVVMGQAAADLGVGILYNRGQSTDVFADHLENVESVILLGGNASQSEKVEKDLVADGKTVERIAGATRYSTAVAVAKRFHPDADRMILANGSNPADANTSAPLSAKYNAPVLLTRSSFLSPEVKTYMEEENPVKAYIIGGEMAVSEKVRAEIEQLLQ